MLFNSLEFFVFLPFVLLLFATAPASLRWLLLLLASLLFYGLSRPANLLFLGMVTVVTCAIGWALHHAAHPAVRRFSLAVGLAALFGSLVAFKFYDFAAVEIEGSLAVALPRLGISAPAGYSFYVFSAASYLIDAYARRIESFDAGRLALYAAWFPKILAGPIERAPAFLPQVARPTTHADLIVSALPLIVWGLFKKVVIADNLSPMVDRNFAIAAYASPVELLISVYFFAFQIYCDFSGYTDIAVGVSRLFGIRLMENFRHPYLSRSTAEFWGERWHISLGRWFRDYLYIPLGGSRAGRLRQYLNVMLVFVLSGLWHAGLGYGVGWTFLIWGALNGAYQWAGLATRGLWQRLAAWMPAPLRHSAAVSLLRVLLTFHLIALSWIFFRAKTVGDAIIVLRKIAINIAEFPSLLIGYPFTAEVAMGVALIALLLIVEVLDERRPIAQRLATASIPVRWGAYYAMIFGLLILGRWQAKEFMYMQF